MSSVINPKPGFLHSGAGPLLWSLLFLIIFVGVFFTQETSAIVINNGTIKNVFSEYGLLAGPVLALLAMLTMYILAGIKRIIGLGKFRFLNPVVILIIMGPLLAFGYQLKFREPEYTDIARGIIGYLALPLLISSGVVCVLAILWLLITLLRRS
ncbi:MAG: hypothetical protein PHZ00_02430 [Candidatus Peribacteraceae bacterium]|nr:hypothetical protein [Candidatus Peribacteraceae bacterium]